MSDDGASAIRFAFASLAVWRATHLLVEEDGPANAVARLRARVGDGALGEVMDCFYCLSAWVAAPVSLTVARRVREVPLAWLALSGAACLLERATSAPIAHPKGENDGLLWREAEEVEGEPNDGREPARRPAAGAEAEPAHCAAAR